MSKKRQPNILQMLDELEKEQVYWQSSYDRGQITLVLLLLIFVWFIALGNIFWLLMIQPILFIKDRIQGLYWRLCGDL